MLFDQTTPPLLESALFSVPLGGSQCIAAGQLTLLCSWLGVGGLLPFASSFDPV